MGSRSEPEHQNGVSISLGSHRFVPPPGNQMPFRVLRVTFLSFVLLTVESFQPEEVEASCPWLYHSGEDNLLICEDGSTCNWDTHPEGTSCCKKRARCPRNFPIMCKDATCGNGNLCCSSADVAQEGAFCSASGGRRVCQDLAICDVDTFARAQLSLPGNCQT